MKGLGYIGAFLGGAVAGAVIGLLVAPESGKDTRTKVSDTVNDFLKKHNIKLSRKDVEDLVDDIQEVTPDESHSSATNLTLTTCYQMIKTWNQ